MSQKKNESTGLKFDGAKPDMSLLPHTSLHEVARVLTAGAAKYGRHNWKGGIHISRLIAAAMRHIGQFNDGEDIDAETNTSHLANASANLLFALWMMEHRKDLDDRYTTTLEEKRNEERKK